MALPTLANNPAFALGRFLGLARIAELKGDIPENIIKRLIHLAAEYQEANRRAA